MTSKTLQTTVLKRAAALRGNGNGAEVRVTFERQSSHKPEGAVSLTQWGELIRLGCDGLSAREAGAWPKPYSGVLVHDGYAYATDRYRMVKAPLANLGTPTFSIPAALCYALVPLTGGKAWENVSAWYVAQTDRIVVQGRGWLASMPQPLTAPDELESMANSYDSIMQAPSPGYDTGVPFPKYDDTPYQVMLCESGYWAGIPEGRAYDAMRSEFISKHRGTYQLVLDGTFAEWAAGLAGRGTVTLPRKGERHKATYACNPDTNARVVVMPVKLA